jgi:hypothetical protein
MAGKAAKVVFLILLAGLHFCLAGCTLYMAAAFKHSKAEGGLEEGEVSLPAQPQQVSTSATEVTLAWDAPLSDVSVYRVLFRIHETDSWYSLIDDLSAGASPEYAVQHGDVGSGIFDFGVIAVNAQDEESQLHHSLQNTAQPDSGWYLVWQD